MRKDNEYYINPGEQSPVVEQGQLPGVEDCLKSVFRIRIGGVIEQECIDMAVANYLRENPLENVNGFDVATREIGGILIADYGDKGVNKQNVRGDVDEDKRAEIRKIKKKVKNIFSGLNSNYEIGPILEMASDFGINRVDEKFAIETLNYLDRNLQGVGAEEMARLFGRALYLESLISSETSIKFPDTKRGYGEFLVGLHKNNFELIVVACPDYQKNYNLGDGLGTEANLYLNNIPKFLEILVSNGITISGSIVIANTEDDMREVLKRLTNGNREEFLEKCRTSAQKLMVDQRLSGFSNNLFVGLLTDLIPDFRSRQYKEEDILSRRTYTDHKFEKEIKRLSKQRADKYRDILGRNECGGELTIRYMAQYKALSKFLDEQSSRTGKIYMIFNYSTPNLEFLRDAGDQSSCVFEVQKNNDQ